MPVWGIRKSWQNNTCFKWVNGAKFWRVSMWAASNFIVRIHTLGRQERMSWQHLRMKFCVGKQCWPTSMGFELASISLSASVYLRPSISLKQQTRSSQRAKKISAVCIWKQAFWKKKYDTVANVSRVNFEVSQCRKILAGLNVSCITFWIT